MAPITCIITGCELYDPGAYRWAHGDLHQAGEVYIFNAVTNEDGDTDWKEGEPLHACRVLEVKPHHPAFERRGVFVLPAANTQFNARAIAYLRGDGQ